VCVGIWQAKESVGNKKATQEVMERLLQGKKVEGCSKWGYKKKKSKEGYTRRGWEKIQWGDKMRSEWIQFFKRLGNTRKFCMRCNTIGYGRKNMDGQ
jgi:hypothetical protein